VPLTEDVFFDSMNLALKEIPRGVISTDSVQWQIVRVAPEDRVLRILAGPGSGKTEMLVWRILYELFVSGVSSNEVLATTFTKKAATELQVRLTERSELLMQSARKLGVQAQDPRIFDMRVGTIHSLCDSILAEHDDDYMEQGTQVIDEFETLVRIAREYRQTLGYENNRNRVLNRLIDRLYLTRLFCAPWEQTNWPSNNMDRVMLTTSLLAQQTETWIPRCASKGLPNGIESSQSDPEITADLVKLQVRWREYLEEFKVLDFNTLQLQFLEKQLDHIGRFKHVFVDEFQDNNPIQFAIHMQWLENAGLRLTVVGDDDQAIYRFRGSDIGCFSDVESYCEERGIPFRHETLETNYRSTRNIVQFGQQFRSVGALSEVSMKKEISAATDADLGSPVRHISGPWDNVCDHVASEIAELGVGMLDGVPDPETVPTAAVLMFSTSERVTRDWIAPASVLTHSLENRGLRVYNPRNKCAADRNSGIGSLLGMISYLIDPVTKAPVGSGNRQVEVWASSQEEHKADAATSAPPPFPINDRHAAFQKALVKGNGGRVGSPAADRASLFDLADTIRENLLALPEGSRARLNLAGYIARLITQPYFRQMGFTMELFRQGFFTQLLESSIAPTRLSQQSLDQPLEARVIDKKIVWPDRFWSLLGHFGALLDEMNMDDPEVEAFEDHAVPLVTFHQAKGLEFDHVYVACAGRDSDIGPVLRTLLFSGQEVSYGVTADGISCDDQRVMSLAEADRDREVYVALTRPRTQLTILQDTNDPIGFARPNDTIEQMFSELPEQQINGQPALTLKEWVHV